MRKQRAKELQSLWIGTSRIFVFVAVFSFFLNILMLTGPIYMMQVYDRVLSTKSEATLVALTLIVLFLYTMMTVLDVIRSKILTRLAAQFQSKLDERVFHATLRYSAVHPKSDAHPGLQDIEAVQRLLSSPAIHALFDLPWVPLFLFALWMFDPALFALALLGGGILAALSFLNQRVGRKYNQQTYAQWSAAQNKAEQMRRNAVVIQSMGMGQAAYEKWAASRHKALQTHVQSTDITGAFTISSRSFRLMLQSLMLGLGSYLVLQGGLSPGAMIAASVLLGRALAPIETGISQWPLIERGRSAWASLNELLANIPDTIEGADRMPPKGALTVKDLTVIPPGQKQAILKMVNFELHPGQACGVIGPSGAGKSSLAQALINQWPPAGGEIKLGGVPIQHCCPKHLGNMIGYLPQTITVFDGTIGENIARLDAKPDAHKLQSAMILSHTQPLIQSLPDGANTQIRADATHLSGGQLQRIGLARAVYGSPHIVILDEPNSNLDNDGNDALNAAVKTLKAQGKIVLIMAHRPAAIHECDMLLMLEGGTRKAFGPKEDVLRQIVHNHADIRKASIRKGAA
ncbi:MAG: type I secretion system permease/ATPase [Planktomarina sp.]